MGGFYGSVQVRSENRAAVLEAAEMVARAKDIHCLVGPALYGWIGIYPEHHGQDGSVGKDIANQLGGVVLHVMVHDDDVLAYWLWRDRLLVDAYWSKPGYFGDENLEDEQRRAGDAEQFRFILDDPAIAKLRTLLRRDEEPVFEYERLEALGKLLGIANLVTAYEHLKEEEPGPVKGRRQFKEVLAPVVAREKSQRTAETRRMRAERKRLTQAGVLLFVDERPMGGLPRVCAARDGFLLAWVEHAADTASLTHLAPPWQTPTEPLGLELPPHPHLNEMASSRDGQRIALACGTLVRVYDSHNEQWQTRCDIPDSGGTIGVGISPDGSVVAHVSGRGVVVTDLQHPQRAIAVANSTDVNKLAVHPDNRWVATSGNKLGIISLDQDPHWRDLYVGRIDPPPASAGAMQWWKTMDVDSLLEQQAAGIKMAMKRLQAMVKPGSKEFTPESLEAARQNMEALMEQRRRELIDLKQHGPPAPQPQSKERVSCVGFSRDGRLFWLGTHLGLRVYEWEKMPRQPGSATPPPLWQFELPPPLQIPPPQRVNGYVYAIAEEPAGGAIAFAGGDGHLYRMNLDDGSARDLLKLPNGGAVLSLDFTVTGDALCATSHLWTRQTLHRLNQQRVACEVWAYPALLAAQA